VLLAPWVALAFVGPRVTVVCRAPRVTLVSRVPRVTRVMLVSVVLPVLLELPVLLALRVLLASVVLLALLVVVVSRERRDPLASSDLVALRVTEVTGVCVERRVCVARRETPAPVVLVATRVSRVLAV